MQMKDLEVDKVGPTLDKLKVTTNQILNPEKPTLERLYTKINKGDVGAIDSIIYEHAGVYNNLTSICQKEMMQNKWPLI